MPSFFFHIVVDLIRPSEEAGSFISSRSSIFGIQKVPRPSSQTPADIASYARTFPTAQPGAGHLQALGPESSTAGPADSVSGDHDRANDWRSGPITLQCIDMVRSVDTSHTSSTTGPPSKTRSGNGITAGPAGPSVKGRYEPVDKESKELGWGIIRLFRDSEESPILDENVSHTKGSKHGRNTGSKNGGGNTEEQPIKDEDCTTLCILAVPSYMTPSDFLGAVGEKTREDVSHFRMIRTDKINRYMVLMKFRSAKTAREWRKEWDGKQLNAMQVS